MTVSLSKQTQQLIDAKVQSGKYQTPEDVIAAAISQLDQHEQPGDFEPGELDSLLEKGERSGSALDGEQVLTELRKLRDQSTPR